MKGKGDNDDSLVVKAPKKKMLVNNNKNFFQQPKSKYKLQGCRLHDLPAGPTQTKSRQDITVLN
jgi:hypothetical protein